MIWVGWYEVLFIIRWNSECLYSIKAQNRALHNLANNNLSSINQTSALMWVIRKPLIEKKNHCLVSENIFVLHFCCFYFFSVVNKPHLKKDIISKCYFYEVYIGIFKDYRFIRTCYDTDNRSSTLRLTRLRILFTSLSKSFNKYEVICTREGNDKIWNWYQISKFTDNNYVTANWNLSLKTISDILIIIS